MRNLNTKFMRIYIGATPLNGTIVAKTVLHPDYSRMSCITSGVLNLTSDLILKVIETKQADPSMSIVYFRTGEL